MKGHAIAPMVNNDYYNHLGERWYDDDKDPVALLRAERKIKNPWILEHIEGTVGAGPKKILDIGCGGGFLSNDLASHGHHVTGIDLSASSLAVARAQDATKSVEYINASAYEIPLPDAAFDVVCAMDFLEHVEEPGRVIQEASRLLRPGGVFFFHTFNRNFASWLLVIKFVEWFVPKTPKHLHVLHLFITPEELEKMMRGSGLKEIRMWGLRPKFMTWAFWRSFFTRRVYPNFSFTMTSSLRLAYIGHARKC